MRWEINLMRWFQKLQRRQLIYAPKPDITAWELAQLMKLNVPGYDPVKLWEGMPDNVRRHCYIRGTK